MSPNEENGKTKGLQLALLVQGTLHVELPCIPQLHLVYVLCILPALTKMSCCVCVHAVYNSYPVLQRHYCTGGVVGKQTAFSSWQSGRNIFTLLEGY